jgi:GTP-binding protein YchF
VALTIGIVGLPNVGKSTLFNALTRAEALAANYPFATIDPNVGMVPLPDERLEVLSDMFHSQKVVPATVSFVDIAGIVKGASEGEGLGNKFLANIREADAICQVTRAFSDPDVVHVDGAVSPASDLDTINTELIIADLQTLEKALPRIEKEVKRKQAEPEVLDAMKKAQAILEDGHTLYSQMQQGKFDAEPIRELQLMTAKPFLYVFNVDDDGSWAITAKKESNCAPWWHRSRRSSSTPSSSPSSRSSSPMTQPWRCWSSTEPGRARSGPAGPGGLRHPGPADLPDGGGEGVARVDDPQGRHRTRRPPASSTADFERGFIKAEIVSV